MLKKRLGLPIMLDRVTEDRSGEQSSRPLVGIRVLELGRVLAGPFCGMLLADLGAEVIKVEPPHGDDARTFGPFVDGASTYYRLLNRDKLGISLDLKQSDQLAVLQRLIERSDVLIENFRPETLERLGLPVARIRELNPRLVVVSITGFGHSGPLRDLPAYDLLIQAMSGLMAATGPVDGDPTRSAVSLGDLVPGLYGALGALAVSTNSSERALAATWTSRCWTVSSPCSSRSRCARSTPTTRSCRSGTTMPSAHHLAPTAPRTARSRSRSRTIPSSCASQRPSVGRIGRWTPASQRTRSAPSTATSSGLRSRPNSRF